jgi:predicted Holliday junction resolvase-like endonuclease
MITDYTLSACLVLVCAFLVKLYYYQQGTIKRQLKDINKILSQKKSSEVRLGQIGEHFAPLLKDFPYNSKNVRFLGSPIDFVVFDLDNNRIIFIEFKTGNAKETVKQRKVRDIIKAGNVTYEVMRVYEDVTIA